MGFITVMQWIILIIFYGEKLILQQIIFGNFYMLAADIIAA